MAAFVVVDAMFLPNRLPKVIDRKADLIEAQKLTCTTIGKRVQHAVYPTQSKEAQA